MVPCESSGAVDPGSRNPEQWDTHVMGCHTVSYRNAGGEQFVARRAIYDTLLQLKKENSLQGSKRT